MDADTRIILISICGGVLGWALGTLLDVLISQFKIQKSKWTMICVVVAMIIAIFWLKFQRLPNPQ